MRFAIRKKLLEPQDFGPLRMRMQRFGRANNAFYNIVIAQARHRRNGKYIDLLGTYYPHASDNIKHVNLDFDRAKFWIAQGAEPTGIVEKLLSKAGLLPSRPRTYELVKDAENVAENGESKRPDISQ